MDPELEALSNQEIRSRLLKYENTVPPVTASTRKLLLKKLVKLETKQATPNKASEVMPPPKPKGSNESIMISSSLDGIKQSQHTIFDTANSPSPRKGLRRRGYRAPDPFETSDSEVDNGSLGRSIMPANPRLASSSPKSTETSLMNVSNWKNAVGSDLDKSSYSSTETKKPAKKSPTKQTAKQKPRNLNSELNKTQIKSNITNYDSESNDEMQTNAQQAIKRWREKQILTQDNASKSSVPRINSQNSRYSRRPQQSYQQKFNIKNPRFILPFFVGFFVVIFGLYFISIQPSSVVLPPGILKSVCAKKGLQGSNCITEQEKIQNLYNSLVLQVQDKYIKNQCDKLDVEPTMNAQTVFEYVSTHENIPPREIDELVELFKSIAKTYSDSPIGYDTSFKINVEPNLPIMCAVKQIFSNMFYLITWLGIVALSVVGLYFVICYITTKSEQYKQEVNQLIESTIILLKERAQYEPNESYIPIIHIRDGLIPVKERQAKSKMWAEVVQYFTESESSVRSEVQEIDGEDFQVWRWVQPMSPVSL